MCRFRGEPDLADVLTDPIVHALMRADGCDPRSVYVMLELSAHTRRTRRARSLRGRPAAAGLGLAKQFFDRAEWGELYGLAADPNEMINLSDDPVSALT